MNRLLRIKFRHGLLPDLQEVNVELQWSVYYSVKQRVARRIEVPATQHIEDELLWNI